MHRPDPDGLGATLVDVLGVDGKKLAAADEDEEAVLQPLARDLARDLTVMFERVVERKLRERV